ncbi:MAG: class I SAM-dependent methyltransferase [Gammaproteobacteria bacterium]
MVKIRTRYLDDRLEQQLGLGYQQVVILGAGLDTRAIRKQASGVFYFEIDDLRTVSLKKAKLEENGIHANVKFIPGDYVADDFIQLLEQNDFDFNRPTHFIWEGNTMYLTPDSVQRVMADIVKYLRRFTLSFDYMAEEVIAKTTGDPGVAILVESFANMGAPWSYGIADIKSLAEEAKMTVADNFKTAELHRAYWPNRTVDSAIFDFYSLCTLGSS